MTAKKQETHLWYQLPVDEVFEILETHAKNGLSTHIAEKGIIHFGRNVLTEEEKRTPIDRIVSELKNPLTFILLIAGIITTLLGHYVDSTIIFIALIINITISLYQEGRAGNAFERLRNSQQKFATVIRDGAKKLIPAEYVTVGDILVLETGMYIAADVRIFIANNLEINESPLTGEWIDVAKVTTPYDTVIPYTEQKNMGFMGTLISGGSGLGVVVAVGNSTRIGAIAKTLGDAHIQNTPLQENIANVARLLSYIVLGALIIIFTLGLYRGEQLTELFLISIAIAVAAIPEGLPAAVTVVLAIGMEAILKRGGLVRNLLAAETLGSTTIILTDKTGTLTKAEMVLAKIITLGGILMDERAHLSEHKEHEAHGDERDVLEFATLSSDAFIEKTGGNEDPLTEQIVRGRPVDRAIVVAALKSGQNQTELLHNYPRIDFLPFESKYRISLSLHHIRGMKHNRIYIKGSPEFILEHSGAMYLEGKTHIASNDKIQKLERILKHYASEGYRVIGVAYRDVTINAFGEDSDAYRATLTKGLIFCGFIVLHDPLRADIKESILTAQKAGARVIMLTGDNQETARTIAHESGIWKEGDIIHKGSDLENMTDDELADALHKTTVLARMLPEHKLRIVRVLSARGEVVAMTGDGVNDAPALRAADIGIALGSGTEVAKEASGLILIDNSFSTIVAAIEEGRRIIDNLRKIVAYLLSTSFTEIFVVGGALVLGIPIPLLPAHILWTNMLTEGFMNFAFAFEPKEGDLMMRDPKVAGAKQMLSRKLMIFIIVVGLLSGLILLSYYLYQIKVTHMNIADARTLTFVALTLGTIFTAFSIKDLRTPLYKIEFWTNRYLLSSFAFGIFGLVLALQVDFFSTLLRLTDISITANAPILFSMILLNLCVVELVKYFSFERHREGMVR